MNKTLYYTLLALSLSILPMGVHAESPAEICSAEAADAGIEDADEKQQYIAECIEQVKAEMGNGQQNEMDSASAQD